ncbi:MAG TPA: PEP/pyruvate-binding domain-containing protein [Polyangiaceae bacterium]|nr:PEP/pyruvate-binding domain-containing protein [Polyangiaceae bacterium]
MHGRVVLRRNWGVAVLGSAALACCCFACGESRPRHWACQIPSELSPPAEPPDALPEIGCETDFLALASEPLAPSIPGARSVKTSIDREADFALNFQNSLKFPIHWKYLSEQRSAGQGLPRVPALDQFNRSEYYLPSRRFLLGALTHYEGPDKWAYEITPYDTADAQMIAEAYRRIARATFLGDALYFHPTSLNVERAAAELPRDVKLLTTDELFGGISYQALNLGESLGRLRFVKAAELEQSYVTYRDIVVLDHVPNDISVTEGIITAEFQTPLSHINVLSQNRGTPNMALKGILEDPDLLALDGQWVRLKVDPSDYTLEPVSQAEADAWWDQHKPAVVQVPGLDDSISELYDVGRIVPDTTEPGALLAAIKQGTRAFGGKASNYSVLSRVPGVRVPPGFAVPVYYYRQFMREHGLDQRIAEWLQDDSFVGDARERDRRLQSLRSEMESLPLNADFERLLTDKIAREYPGVRMRFRSSTNAEDLDGFTGAGLYTSRSGELGDPESPIADAVRTVWASVWSFRAFEERSYRGIDHQAVAMALLVHRAFPQEEANGVALTNNPFDTQGVDPAFYVNVQTRGVSVVQPEPGIVSEEFLYYFDSENQPVSYLAQSSLIGPGERVLELGQVQELGSALDAIRSYFQPAYAPAPGASPVPESRFVGSWWAMDIEFKFDGERDETPLLYVKQARPYGNR